MRDRWGRLAPLTGLVFAVLVVVALFGGSSPNSDASAASVVAFYVKHHTGQNVSGYALAYSAVFLLFFAAVLRSRLGSGSRSDGLMSLGFGGAVVLAIGLAVAAVSTLALTDVPTKISPISEQALNVVSNDFPFAFIQIGMAAFFVGYGIAIVRTGALARWLGWVAIVLAILAAVPMIFWFALLGLPAWSAIVGVLLFIREGRAPAPPAAATQTP
jgi:hypothetical protein